MAKILHSFSSSSSHSSSPSVTGRDGILTEAGKLIAIFLTRINNTKGKAL